MKNGVFAKYRKTYNPARKRKKYIFHCSAIATEYVAEVMLC